MQTRFIILLAVSLLFASTISAQIDNADNNKRPHNLGVSAGSTSGFGLSYKYFPDKFGFQTNGFLYVRSGETITSLGGSFLYSIKRQEKYNFYAHFSAMHLYEHYWTVIDSVKVIDDYHMVNMGPGIGIEFLFQYINLSFQIGFGAYDNFRVYTMLAGGVGVHYRF